jgi:DNA-binding NarL/FixJ family response regulator
MHQSQRSDSRITVIIADGDPDFRRGLAETLDADPGFVVLSVQPDAQRTIAAVKELKPDLLLTDLLLPGVSSVLIAVSYKSPCTRPVLMCSAFMHHDILEGLYRGALGVWMKDRPDLMEESLRCVASGGCWLRNHEVHNITSVVREIESDSSYTAFHLTPREQEVVLLTSFGMTNRDIGTQLNMKENTVKRHMTNMLKKLGASNRLELTRFVLERGLISADTERQGVLQSLSGAVDPAASPK